jgi:hypothetical protein
MNQPGNQGHRNVAPDLDASDIQAAFGKAQRQETNLADGGKQVRSTFEIPGNATGRKCKVQLDRKKDKNGKDTEVRQQLQTEEQGGRKIKGDRLAQRAADGSVNVSFNGTIDDPTAGAASVTFTKTIGPDGSVIGQGVVKIVATGETATFTLEDTVAANAPNGAPTVPIPPLPSTAPATVPPSTALVGDD